MHESYQYGIIYYRIAADVCGLCLRELDASSFLFLMLSLKVHTRTNSVYFYFSRITPFASSISCSTTYPLINEGRTNFQKNHFAFRFAHATISLGGRKRCRSDTDKRGVIHVVHPQIRDTNPLHSTRRMKVPIGVPDCPIPRWKTMIWNRLRARTKPSRWRSRTIPGVSTEKISYRYLTAIFP